jgi:hypothetical protein
MSTFNPNQKYYYCKKSGTRHFNIKLTPLYTIDIKYGGMTASYNKKYVNNNIKRLIEEDTNEDTYEVSLYKDKTQLCLNEYDLTEGFASVEKINDFMKVVQTKSEIAILQYFRILNYTSNPNE